MDWTDEQVGELKRMHRDGLTGGRIAAEFGITRNAVIGKIHRLGLSLRGSIDGVRPRKPKAPEEPKPKPRRVKRLSRDAHRSNHFHVVETTEMPIRELPAEEVPVAQRKQLLDLSFWHCRWPYGDPSKDDFFFCGAVKLEHGSYCAAHARVACAPAYVRRDRRPPFRRDV